jgi:hypothetical protein
MITAAQIREMIRQLIDHKTSLDGFEEWFSAASWNAHKHADPESMELIGKVELSLAEESSKSDDETLRNLASIAGLFTMGEPPSIQIATSGSIVSGESFSFPFESWVGADIRFSMESSCTLLQPA